MTPHINAKRGDFAPCVIMPGDPYRSRMIAQKYLTAPRLVNDVRGVQGYTGSYRGAPLSVMASGMGMPSMAIYAHELFETYGVQTIIRAGSAGALAESLRLRDIVVAESAYTDSSIVSLLGLKPHAPVPADEGLLSLAKNAAAHRGARVIFGKIYTSDLFYSPTSHKLEHKNAGALAVEMETASLYAVAEKHGCRALSLLTVSDFALTGEGLNADERERTFTDMIELALEIASHS